MKKIILMAAALLSFGFAMAQDAQEVTAKYNEGATALQSKNFTKAAELFTEVISKGQDSEDSNVLSLVQTAKKYLPVCYRNMGMAAASKGDFATAIEKLSVAANKAELYGDTPELNKVKAVLGKVYYAQGGSSYNNKDYATAAEIFAKGYAANPRDTKMALALAQSYCELGEYQKGMDVYNAICAMPATKYAEAIAEAQKMKAQYTNNEVAKLQAAGNNDGVIAMAENILATDPTSALAEKIRLNAYSAKKDYAKVIELGEAAAAAQTDAEDKSDVYFVLGAAYNAKEMKPQAIAALQKVVAGNSVEAAKAAIADLTK